MRVAILVAVSAALLGASLLAHAGGPTVVSWNQAADCANVTGWELVVAPITATNPQPSPAAGVGVSVAKNGNECGLNMTRTLNVSGVGPSRFWLRALAGSVKSKESNAVDESLPLAAPAGLTIAVP